MKRTTKILLIGCFAAAPLGACASAGAGGASGTLLRPAQDVPDHFLVGLPQGSETFEPKGGEGCRNPMVDPRDGTRLRLERSIEPVGDYEVPAGRYGVDAGELLRLDCGTGRALGIVAR